jgi:phosphomannomutase
MTPAIADGVSYCFAENGLDAYKRGVPIEKQSLNLHLGEDNLKRLVNFCLHYIADLDIPIKR